MTIRLSVTVLCGLVICSVGCSPKKPASAGKTAPAKVEAHPDEADAYLVTLTPEAVQRLGITTAPVENRTLPRQRVLAGEVTVPAGRRIVVTAPVGGTLAPPEQGEIPLPGSHIDAGQPLFSLKPLLTPERDVLTPAERVMTANARVGLVSAQIVAEGEVASTKAEVDGAKINLERARKLLADRAGSQRNVDELNATLQIAQERLQAAEARKKALDALTLDGPTAGQVNAIPIAAPAAGTLQTLSAAEGQIVSPGAILLEIANLDRLWIRVPVYVGQRNDFDTKATADVMQLGGQPLASPKTAEPIAAPPSADPLTSSVDFYYRVDNADGALLPGQRVGVALPLAGEEGETRTVPWAAILHDVNGTTWVYEQVEPNVFRRRRVLVRHVLGDTALLTRGPDPGTEVVLDGVAELFGTEFGAGK